MIEVFSWCEELGFPRTCYFLQEALERIGMGDREKLA